LRFLDWVESWFRDLLVYGVTRGAQDVVNADILSEIQQQSTSTEFERLFSLIAKAKEAVEGIQRNLNRRMLLEDLLLNTVEAS
jgi:DNA polymerase III gamma/tau subunit